MGSGTGPQVKLTLKHPAWDSLWIEKDGRGLCTEIIAAAGAIFCCQGGLPSVREKRLRDSWEEKA